MARSRPGLQDAVRQILQENGKNGKKLSLRQAERLTGLSPATVGELANGNARTPETIRRFARGFHADPRRLLLLAGFVPEEMDEREAAALPPISALPAPTVYELPSEPDTQEWLGRFGRALAKMPPGRDRELWKETLRRNTELLESFLSRLPDAENTEGEKGRRGERKKREQDNALTPNAQRPTPNTAPIQNPKSKIENSTVEGGLPDVPEM